SLHRDVGATRSIELRFQRNSRSTYLFVSYFGLKSYVEIRLSSSAQEPIEQPNTVHLTAQLLHSETKQADEFSLWVFTSIEKGQHQFHGLPSQYCRPTGRLSQC